MYFFYTFWSSSNFLFLKNNSEIHDLAIKFSNPRRICESIIFSWQIELNPNDWSDLMLPNKEYYSTCTIQPMYLTYAAFTKQELEWTQIGMNRNGNGLESE